MLILCESQAQAAAAPSIAEILALTPEVAWHCQQSARPYRKLEEFYSETALAAKHPAMFQAELDWIDFTDRFIANVIPEFGKVRFRPALATSFLFQTLFDEFFFASHALSGLLSETSGPIYYWPSTAYSIPNHLHPNQSVVPSVLADIAGGRARAMAPLTVESAFEPPAHRSLKPVLRRVLRNRWMGEYRQLRHGGFAAYLGSCLTPSRSPRILVLEGGYDLDPLVLELRRGGCTIDWLTDLLPSSRPEPHDRQLFAAFQEIVEQPAFWKPLEHSGLRRNPLAEASLAYWWRQLIPQFWRAFRCAQKAFLKNEYAAVLSWEAAAGTLIAPMLQASEYAGVPSVLYQHGSSARTSGTWWFSWLAHADKLLVYGGGTARQLTRTFPASPQARAALVPVGSARLDSLKASMTPARVARIRRRLRGNDPRPIALYVPTYFGGYGRATSDAASYPEVSYFETQQRVFRAFAEFPNVRLLYKDLQTVNSLANPVPEFLRKHVPNASLMPVPPRLAEAMFAVDLIIVDHVITALGEALLTGKPVIVYDPGAIDAIPEAPDARELLRKRVHLATTSGEFENIVRAFLEAGDFSPVAAPDDAFQDAYSTQGASAAAAANEVLSLAAQVTTTRLRAFSRRASSTGLPACDRPK